MEHLTVEDLLVVAETIGAAAVRDIGLLDATAHRPRATAFGQEAYPAIHFYDLNGFDLDPPGVDQAVELVVAVAAGHLELEKLAKQLASWAVSRAGASSG